MFNIRKFLNKAPDWAFQLKSLETLLDTREGLLALDSCIENLDQDLSALKKLGFLMAGNEPVDMASSENAEYLCRLYNEGGGPSLCALAIYACERLRVRRPDLVKPLLMAATLGDIPNVLPYHNNLHFKKVMLQIIRLISVHNGLHYGSQRVLDEHRIALVLIAACIHDYKHDGKGNTLKGVHEMGRLERKSYDLALPYLKKAGLRHKKDMSALGAMLLATDVSPLGSPQSPMRQMKNAYRFHFYDGEKSDLVEGLQGLEKDAALCDMALLLHEADIATSAGIDYLISQYETQHYVTETGGQAACPQHLLDFIDDVCQRQFLSDAGRRLYGANMQRIYALAEEGTIAGNEPFILPEKMDISVLGF